MITRMINICGMALGPGENMLGPLPHNPHGFWENLDFVKINEKLLTCLKAGWDFFPRRIEKGWEFGDAFPVFKNEAEGIIKKFENVKRWGWKDPRNSVTLPFWLRIIPQMKILICLRHPLEVANSIHKRNGNSIAFGLDLWMAYNERLLDAAPPEQRLVTHYNAYFNDPEKECRRVLSWLGWPADEAMIRRACETVADSSRHHRMTIHALSDAEVPSGYRSLYETMCKEAGVINQPHATQFLSPSETVSENKNRDLEEQYQKAAQLIFNNEFSEAAKLLLDLIEECPEHALAHNDLGALYYKKGHKEEALKQFRKASELNPDNITAQKNLADVYVDMKNFQEAIEAYEKIMRIDPEDTDVLLALGALLEMFGQQDDAAFMYERASNLKTG